MFPHPADPLAIAVTEPGACADCGDDLAPRLLSVFHPTAGIVCYECAEARRGVLERCPDCGTLIEPDDIGLGVRLVAGRQVVHDCPRADHDVYALCTQLYEERLWRAHGKAA